MMTLMSPRWLLALAWLAGFTLIDSSIVSLALPDIARDFDQTVGQLAWVSTGFLLALAATLLAAGRLSDRYGQRPVLAIGALGFLAFTLACGLAPSFELLVAARVAQELVAMGSRTPQASLAGSGAAFAIRTAVLAVPLVLVLVDRRSALRSRGLPSVNEAG